MTYGIHAVDIDGVVDRGELHNTELVAQWVALHALAPYVEGRIVLLGHRLQKPTRAAKAALFIFGFRPPTPALPILAAVDATDELLVKKAKAFFDRIFPGFVTRLERIDGEFRPSPPYQFVPLPRGGHRSSCSGCTLLSTAWQGLRFDSDDGQVHRNLRSIEPMQLR